MITASDYMKDHIFSIFELRRNCTGIAEVMGSNPVQASLNFFQALISQLLKLCL